MGLEKNGLMDQSMRAQRDYNSNEIGSLIHTDDDVIYGHQQEDKDLGYGILFHLDGAKYKDYWKKDQQHGKKLETFQMELNIIIIMFREKKHGISPLT